jgi:lysophospholipase L1-like esterase
VCVCVCVQSSSEGKAEDPLIFLFDSFVQQSWRAKMARIRLVHMVLLALVIFQVIGVLAIPVSRYANISALSELEMVELLGRFDGTRAQWSGTGIQLYVVPTENYTEPTLITINYSDCSGTCNYYIETLVDCESYMTTEISETAFQAVSVSIVLPPGGSKFQFIKRTEPFSNDAEGVMQVDDYIVSRIRDIAVIRDIEISGGYLTAASSGCFTPTRKILFIGDSITAAFGVDDTDPCEFQASTENILHSYATLVANALEAEAHILAISGIGVVHNIFSLTAVSDNPMPVFYNRTIPSEADSYWAPSGFSPDVVYVMLGTNDFSSLPQPTDEEFQNGYAAFLTQIHSDYPNAKIMIACAPMKPERLPSNFQAVAEANADLISAYLDIPTTTMTDSGSNGCDGHPSQQGQVNMANLIVPVMEKLFSV